MWAVFWKLYGLILTRFVTISISMTLPSFLHKMHSGNNVNNIVMSLWETKVRKAFPINAAKINAQLELKSY